MKSHNTLLTRARKERAWSQKDVAEKIGTRADTVNRWERGEDMPSPRYQQKLCALFSKTPLALGFLQNEEGSCDQQPVGSAHTMKSHNALLTRARKERAWSQQDVAEKIGAHPDTVGLWERGEAMPTPSYQQKLCNLFSKTPLALGFLQNEQGSRDQQPVRSAHMSIDDYTRTHLNKTLYPYQREIAAAILDSVFNNRGLTISVLLARQMGKNEVSAIIESYLLTHIPSGTLVKAAPTSRPQIINSLQRLLSMLEHPLTRKRIWKAYGFQIGLAPDPESVSAQTGPRILFFSASPDANIVGATASLLLEVDEAQDVSVEKFNRDLRPMCSTSNCTTVLWGTAWSDDTLLAQAKATNQELEAIDGIKRHFEYDWTILARINPNYKTFVEHEIARLGADHLTIRTQYRLQTISGAGFLLNEQQRYLLRGKHNWQDYPDEDEDEYYVAGMDVGGESRPTQGEELRHTKRDSTIITLARVVMNETLLPSLQIVHQIQWTGLPYLEQYAQAAAICEHWNVRRLVIDRTGLGEVMASLLTLKLGEDRVIPFHFTRPSKSKLTYQFLSLINSGRLKMYLEDSAPPDISEEAWKQLKLARYRVPGENLLDMYVVPEEGHDDFLMSMALCGEAAKDWRTPVVESAVVRPRALYPGEGWY